MGKSCCIKGCNFPGPDVEYFKFPRGGSLLAAWVKATGAASGDVCSAHFALHDYKSTRGKRRLLGTAVPSVFNPASKTCSDDVSSAHFTLHDYKSTRGKRQLLGTAVPSVFNNTEKPPSTTENGDISSTDKTIDIINKNDNVKSKNKKGKKIMDKSKLEASDNTNKASPTDKIVETTDNNVNIDYDKLIEKAKIGNGESSKDDTRQAESSEDNAKDVKANDPQPEIKDIEDLITNYQIKQTKPLADRLNPEPLEDLIPAILETQPKQIQIEVPQIQETSIRPNKLDVTQLASQLADKLDNRLAQIMATAPVFIEVAVNQNETRTESPQDCVMLLESVQCDVDPSSLMLPEHGPDTDSDMEIVDCDAKIEDPNPISLLTSSDEDEVIIEEPHIDTVEVSDETDEDDKPLQRLVVNKPKPKPKPEKPKKKGNYENCVPFYCVQCDFRTDSELEYRQHNLELAHLHGTTIQVCQTCNYSTASKAQFSRHKRKHRDERNFKCHLCNYKARHNMSLIYHLKCHDPVEKKQEKFTCDKCGFSSNVKSEALNHLKGKGCDGNKYSCDQCSYSTKRRSDLRRHKLRRHSVDDSDEDFTL